MNKVFKKVGALHPSVNRFNLSFDRTFDADFGELIPILGEELVPGESIRVHLESVIRMQPTVAPILHEIDVFTHFFFVPNRLLMDDKDHGWELFLTGGVSGDESISLPLWNLRQREGDLYNVSDKYSLSDYFDIPTGVAIPDEDVPIGFLQRSYNLIYNEYYRDQNYMDEVDLTNNLILNRCWEKDYFTSALPMQQRGTAPAFPISGVLPVNFETLRSPLKMTNSYSNPSQIGLVGGTDSNPTVYRMIQELNLFGRGSELILDGVSRTRESGGSSLNTDVDLESSAVSASIDLQDAITFDVSDMRFAFQVQKWMERNMRAGVRYTEFLKAHFGVSPTDSRLQRPEYVGGCKSHVVISEVAQTSATDSTSPQGNLAGRGLVADFNKITKFVAPEYGYLVGIMSIMPKAKYFQGLDMKFSRKSRFDWLMPEFVNLSEQPVLNKEIFLGPDTAENNGNFGYQGIYNEMRSHQSKVNGALRDTLDYWHLGRKFSNLPVLNADFLECDATKDGLKRIFAVQDEKGFICNFGFHIRALLPLPVVAEPGLIDHH